MEGRRAARERALELLYEAEAKSTTAADIVDGLPVAPDAYACTLVIGVDDHLDEIDTLVASVRERLVAATYARRRSRPPSARDV